MRMAPGPSESPMTRASLWRVGASEGVYLGRWLTHSRAVPAPNSSAAMAALLLNPLGVITRANLLSTPRRGDPLTSVTQHLACLSQEWGAASPASTWTSRDVGSALLRGQGRRDRGRKGTDTVQQLSSSAKIIHSAEGLHPGHTRASQRCSARDDRRATR